MRIILIIKICTGDGKGQAMGPAEDQGLSWVLL